MERRDPGHLFYFACHKLESDPDLDLRHQVLHSNLIRHMLRRQQLLSEQEQRQKQELALCNHQRQQYQQQPHQQQQQQQQHQQQEHNDADLLSRQDAPAPHFHHLSTAPSASSPSSSAYRANPFDQWPGLSGEEKEEREDEGSSSSSLSPATATRTEAAPASPLCTSSSALPLSTSSLVFQSKQHAGRTIPDEDNQWSPFSHQDEFDRITYSQHCRDNNSDEEADAMDYEMQESPSSSWKLPSSLFEQEREEHDDHSTNPISLSTPHSSYLDVHHHVHHAHTLSPPFADTGIYPYHHPSSSSSSPSSVKQQQTHALYASPFLPLPAHVHMYPHPYEDFLDAQYRDCYDASRAQEDWLDAVLGDLMEDEEDNDDDEDDGEEEDDFEEQDQPNKQEEEEDEGEGGDAGSKVPQGKQATLNTYVSEANDREHEPFLEEHDQVAPQDPLPSLSDQGSSSHPNCKWARDYGVPSGEIGGVVERTAASGNLYHDKLGDGETRARDDESMWVDSASDIQTLLPYRMMGDPSCHLHVLHHNHLRDQHRSQHQALRHRHCDNSNDLANQKGVDGVDLPQPQHHRQGVKPSMQFGHLSSSPMSSLSSLATVHAQHETMDREDREREARFALLALELRQEQQQLAAASSKKAFIPPPPPPPPPRKSKPKTKAPKPIAFSRSFLRSFAPDQPTEIEIGIASPSRYHHSHHHPLVILDESVCGFGGKIPPPPPPPTKAGITTPSSSYSPPGSPQPISSTSSAVANATRRLSTSAAIRIDCGYYLPF